MPKSRKPPAPIRKIALWGNFGTQNLGNECTLAAMRHNLRQRLPDAEQFCICPEPRDTELRHQIKAVPMRAVANATATARTALPRPLRILRRLVAECAGWLRAAAVMRDADALIIVGTGIMSDSGEGALGFPYELFKWSLLAWLNGGNVLFVSVGVEEMTRPLTRFFLKAAFHLADYRSCRDANSKHLMQAIGFPGEGDKVYPDVAFSLPTGAASAVTTVRMKRKVVAIGIYNYLDRGSAGGDSALAYGAYIHAICSFITWLLRRGYSVRVIIGDYAYDRTVVADVRAALLASGEQLEPELYADEPASSFEQLIEQIKSVDLVVASRFHNVLLSLMLAKPVLSVSYDAKNEELMGQVGLTRYCQALDRLDVARLLIQFQELEQQAPTLRSSIRTKTSQFRVSLDEQYDLIQRAANF
ncbi:MAG: polysaccharide pyruvyl transferase family protein [Steroidobacteraceae bacterium]